MGWEWIDPHLPGDPVTGEPDDYLGAAADAAAAAPAMVAVGAGWSALVGQLGCERWGGTAAAALAARAGRLRAALAGNGDVLDALVSVWVRHADALSDLRRAAGAALALGLARSDELRAAELQLGGATGALARTERELAALSGHPDSAVAADRIAALTACRWRALDDVRWWQGQVAARADEVAASRAAHTALVESEATLTADTAAALRALAPATTVDTPDPSLTSSGPFAWPHARVLDGFARIADAAVSVALARLAAAITRQLTPFPFAVGPAFVEPWLAGFAGLPRTQQAAFVVALAEVHRTLRDDGRAGDPGGTYDWTPRGSWAGHADGSPAESGAAVAIDALSATVGAGVLAPDEFGVVELEHGRYIVVLPGVTDLTNPHLDLDPRHRTVRDVDEYALPSSTSTALADNRYARMVAEGLDEFGVEPGSELLIVGHSFGADTALDLAADPRFNGPDGYAVTHVVAAGYHSGPQLPFVPDRTDVLVLQNDHDLAVELEQLGEHPVAAAYELGEAWDDLSDANPFGAFGSLWDAGADVGRFGGYLAERSVELGGGLPPLVRLPEGPFGAPVTRVGVTRPTPHQVVSVFDGGRAGMGHHQRNYTDYLATHDDVAVAAFTAALARAGYGRAGQLYAIDVSVPRPSRGSW